MLMLLFFVLVLLLEPSSWLVMGFHDSLNFALPPRTRSCFYESFDATDAGSAATAGNEKQLTPQEQQQQGSSAGSRIIEAFVQSGGNADVWLTIHGPLSLGDIRLESFESPLVKEKIDARVESRSDSLTFTLDFKPQQKGTYAICLDNRQSVLFPKIVQLDVRVPAKPAPIVVSLGGDYTDGQQAELIHNAKETMSRIRKQLTRLQTQQQHNRHRLLLHSEMNQRSHTHVLQGSMIETACFMSAALFQIVFVRMWFAKKTGKQTKSRA